MGHREYSKIRFEPIFSQAIKKRLLCVYCRILLYTCTKTKLIIMKSNPITFRADEEITAMLNTLDDRPTTATLKVLGLFTAIHKETIRELKGRFSRKEILALIDSYKRSSPQIEMMATNYVLVGHTKDSERDFKCMSSNNANLNVLIEKLKLLTSAQSAILQLELWAFSNRNKTDISDPEKFIDRFT